MNRGKASGWLLIVLALASPSVAADPARPWLKGLAEGREEATRLRRPILLRVGAEWCSWCRQEDREIAKSEVQEALGRWTLVALDADRDEKEVQSLGVGPIPAFRLLTPDGRTAAEHEGYLPSKELTDWLGANFDKAAVVPIGELTESGEPTEIALVRLVRLFDRSDAVTREAVVLRLRDHPGVASSSAVDAFAKGSLQARLTALELFDAWHAPIDGIDPWRPSTLTEARLKGLRDWAEVAAKAGASPGPAITPERLAAAIRQIDDYLKADATSLVPSRERLAPFGRALMPAVLDRLKRAETDEARERLTALRYRLASAGALTIEWPGGLDRLASRDVATRHRAVDELIALGSRAEEGLWLELFSDPDPLVRESALRGLNREGSSGTSRALIGLLADPEPNVRAAVLKQLAEHPSPGLSAKIADYVAKETDPDLLVHAVRVLRATADETSLKVLISLLKHEKWSIRAEAIEAVGKRVERVDQPPPEALPALLAQLEDPDGFVVGRAMAAIRELDREDVVEPLIRVAEKHRDLAPRVIEILSDGSVKQARALPKIAGFAKDTLPGVRAAVVKALGNAGSAAIEPEVRAGLDDPDSLVRAVAASVLFEKLSMLKQAHNARVMPGGLIGEVPLAPPLPIPPAPGEVEVVAAGIERAQAPKPEAETQDAVGRHESWLTSFQEGKDKPTWMGPAVGPLTSMLSAASAEERLEAARCLVAIGGHPAASGALVEVVKDRADLVGEAAKVLPFQHWADRLELFKALVAAGPDPDTRAELVESMAEVPDPRAADSLWGLTAREHLALMESYNLMQALQKVLFGVNVQDPRALAKDVKLRIIAEIRPRAETGPEWQRAFALILLSNVEPGEAVSIARGIPGEPGVPPSLRANAYQILLASLPRDEARPIAIAALVSNDPVGRKFAILSLISDTARLQSLREYLQLPYSLPGLQRSTNTNRPSTFVLAKILTEERVRPLLKADDPETAALAGYILALKGDPSGLDPLLAFWRTTELKDGTWNLRASQAIAALDDDSRVALLEQIYARDRAESADSSFNFSDPFPGFYWTIRVMTGPNAKKLRKKIRAEVGMAALLQEVVAPPPGFR